MLRETQDIAIVDADDPEKVCNYNADHLAKAEYYLERRILLLIRKLPTGPSEYKFQVWVCKGIVVLHEFDNRDHFFCTDDCF